MLRPLGDVAEAKAIVALCGKVKKTNLASPAIKAEAAKLEKLGQRVLALAVPVENLAKTTHGRRTSRNALVAEWAKALGLLKRAARDVRVDDPSSPVLDTLVPRGPSRTKQPAAAPAPKPA